MGLFTQRPEEPTQWAGLPSEPEDTKTAAELLSEATGDLLAADAVVRSLRIPMPVADPDGE